MPYTRFTIIIRRRALLSARAFLSRVGRQCIRGNSFSVSARHLRPAHGPPGLLSSTSARSSLSSRFACAPSTTGVAHPENRHNRTRSTSAFLRTTSSRIRLLPIRAGPILPRSMSYTTSIPQVQRSPLSGILLCGSLRVFSCRIIWGFRLQSSIIFSLAAH